MGIACSKKHVYAFQMDSGLVKIGVSYSVEQRAYLVSRKNTDKVTKIFNTSLFSSEKAYKIERACHSFFTNKRAFGEFFYISFAEACQKINEYADTISEKAINDTPQNKLDNSQKSQMKLELNETTIQEKIRRIAAYRGYTLTKLGEEFNRRYGTKYNANTFFRKLRSGAVRYDELQKLGEILNFNIDFSINE